jgi:hypothetical protein
MIRHSVSVAGGVMLALLASGSAYAGSAPGPAAAAPTAYVANFEVGPGTVTPINTATGAVGTAIKAGPGPSRRSAPPPTSPARPSR